MKPQFDVSQAGDMPRVIIEGNYYNGKCFPSLNNMLASYSRSPKIGAALKRKFQRICCDEIREQLKGWQANKPLIGHFIYYEPKDGHYRDFPNIHCFASKVWWDAMQDCGVIRGDDPKYVLNETHDFMYCENVGETRIEVYLEEVSEV